MSSVRSQPGSTYFWLWSAWFDGILISNRIIKYFALYLEKFNVLEEERLL